MTANVAGGDVRQAGREVTGSRWFHWLSRAGLVARGVMYLLIGSLAVQIGLGGGGKEADRKGALETVSNTPGGSVILWLLVVGFAGLALWRYAEAAFGQPVPDGRKMTKRAGSFGRGLFYSVAFAGILNFALGGGAQSSNEQSKTLTAKAMEQPGGRWLVLAVGVGFVAWGIGNIVNALRRKFTKKLKTGEMSPPVRKVVKGLGLVGRSARGVVFGAAGIFLAYAAITFDPDKAKGLDGTLRTFAGTPGGPWALVAVALGLLTFGVYSFCEARWRKVEAVRS
ncbi:MAG TPA: DUF1206 domain-containing protein [Streptosporangiaceae bacterium]|jgi:hypothetical protein